jgi:hypothetical protein
VFIRGKPFVFLIHPSVIQELSRLINFETTFLLRYLSKATSSSPRLILSCNSQSGVLHESQLIAPFSRFHFRTISTFILSRWTVFPADHPPWSSGARCRCGEGLIFLNHGDGAFPVEGSQTISNIGLPATRVVVGDFNGDGITDYVMETCSSGGLSIFLMAGDGTGAFNQDGAADRNFPPFASSCTNAIAAITIANDTPLPRTRAL